ncbi:unnamed protein product [Candidula unifasciata]|uniref:Bactericidal permeability-increasing protein n=1 Tax=Candidula unifasciata TaxID=100452 RepID=A0A8S3ZKC3_9EUPU|nr:unnamed protein product [Candidula unifasciata]
MSAITSVLLLLLLISGLAVAMEPGVRLAVTNKGLVYAEQVAGAELRSRLQTLSFPDQSGSEGSKSWSITNIRKDGISGPDAHISLNPVAGGITLGISNFGISFYADWNIKYRIIFRFSSSGSLDFSISGASVTLVAGLGEKNGRPTVFAKSCSCNAGDIGIKFHGGIVAWILNIFRATIRGKIRDKLQNEVCQIVTEQVNTRADQELSRMKVNLEIAKQFILDYSLTSAPIVTGNYVEVATKGTVYWKDNRQESPFMPDLLPPLSEFSKMLYVDVTEYSVDTLAYVAHTNGFLKYAITVDNLKDHYPNSKLELRISSSRAPSVRFESTKLTIAAAARVEVAAHTPDGVVTPLLLKVSVSVTVEPSVVNGNLTGSITAYNFHNAVIHSDIGEIDEEELDKLIRRAIDEVVIPGLNEYCKQGIPLPVTGIFRLYNAKVNLQKGYMQIATDVEYLK